MNPWAPQPLSLTDVAPLHVQIKAAITTAVVAGELAIGAKLPGTRDLRPRCVSDFGTRRDPFQWMQTVPRLNAARTAVGA